MLLKSDLFSILKDISFALNLSGVISVKTFFMIPVIFPLEF